MIGTIANIARPLCLCQTKKRGVISMGYDQAWDSLKIWAKGRGDDELLRRMEELEWDHNLEEGE